MRLARMVLLFTVALGSAACAAAHVNEQEPVAAGLAKFPSASVETRFEGEVGKDTPGIDARLTERVIQHLQEKKLFAKVDKAESGAGDLAVKMTIVKADKGSALNQLVGTESDATVDVMIEVVDAKGAKKLGRFAVHADSSRRSGRLSVNGVDTATGSNALHRAVDSAATEIGDYLVTHR